ncbi:MAG TPA: glycosyltransferase family 2 protein [Thermoleophilia bacterium]|nr:glycosyltransferase family 2 protein [Thermoleophilia bacterium]
MSETVAPPTRFDRCRIVVPVLDEAAALPGLIDELRRLGLLERTLFVDNGSTDGGPAVIAAGGGALLREPRRGYGYPCLTGARAALADGARVVVFMEADGTDDPSQVDLLARPVLAGHADLVIGSRRAAVRGRQGGMPTHQRLGNDWLALALRVLFGLQLSDDGPFRAVDGALLERLALEERAYAFPTEMAVKARLLGARIVVVETSYRLRAGRSKIGGTWRGSLLAVRDISRCLWRLRLHGFVTGDRPPQAVPGWLTRPLDRRADAPQ